MIVKNAWWGSADWSNYRPLTQCRIFFFLDLGFFYYCYCFFFFFFSCAFIDSLVANRRQAASGETWPSLVLFRSSNNAKQNPKFIWWIARVFARVAAWLSAWTYQPYYGRNESNYCDTVVFGIGRFDFADVVVAPPNCLLDGTIRDKHELNHGPRCDININTGRNKF